MPRVLVVSGEFLDLQTIRHNLGGEVPDLHLKFASGIENVSQRLLDEVFDTAIVIEDHNGVEPIEELLDIRLINLVEQLHAKHVVVVIRVSLYQDCPKQQWLTRKVCAAYGNGVPFEFGSNGTTKHCAVWLLFNEEGQNWKSVVRDNLTA